MTAPEFEDSDLHVETTTIMFADVVESVRLIEGDERGSVNRIRSLFRGLIEVCVVPNSGRVLERRGDGLLLDFASPSDAVRCALAMHVACKTRVEQNSGDQPIKLRIGLHTSQVLASGNELFGHGVNLAARITSLAEPGQTTLSAQTRDLLNQDIDGDFEDFGDYEVKHLAQPLRVYRVFENAISTDINQSRDTLGDSRVVLVVLPFHSSTQQADRTVLGELIADSLNTALSRSHSLRIISRLSTASLRSTDASEALDSCRTKLGANYVLSGRCVVNGEQLRVLVELCDTVSSQIVWADSIPTRVGDLLGDDSELVAHIASQTQLHVIESEITRATVKPLPALRSYTLYLSGLSLMHRQSVADFQRARELFEHLAERHPQSSIPRAWLGKWHMLRVAQGWSNDPKNDARLATQNASRALEREPNNSLCHVVKGVIEAYLIKDFSKADDCYALALEHNPSDALAHLQRAALWGWQGKGELAIASANNALQLSPLDPHMYFSHCLAAAAYLGAGDFPTAEALAKRSLKANRMHVATYKLLAMAQAMQGAEAAAAETVTRIRALSPDFTLSSFESASPWRLHPQFSNLRTGLAAAGLPVH